MHFFAPPSLLGVTHIGHPAPTPRSILAKLAEYGLSQEGFLPPHRQRWWEQYAAGKIGEHLVMISQPQLKVAPHALKVFAPQDGELGTREISGETQPPALHTNLTLSQLFEMAFQPLWCRSRGLSDKTDTLYREALEWWSKLTGDPPLSQIDDWTTARFTALLMQQPGRKSETISIATVRKHCQRIDTLLAFAGPKTRDRRGRKNLGLLELPPCVDLPEPEHDPPSGDFSVEEVQAMHAAAVQMTRPQLDGVSAGEWWRAFLSVACCTGLRIGALMRLQYIDLQPPWVMVWAKNSKRKKGKKQYLSSEALAAVERIRTRRLLIFEFPGWEKNPRWIQVIFKRLAAAAGIPEERRFGFHGLRKLHASLIAGQEQDGVKAAQISLGHGSATTTKQHYVSGKVQDRLAAAAIDRLPSFASRSTRRDEDPRQTHFDFRER